MVNDQIGLGLNDRGGCLRQVISPGLKCLTQSQVANGDLKFGILKFDPKICNFMPVFMVKQCMPANSQSCPHLHVHTLTRVCLHLHVCTPSLGCSCWPTKTGLDI